MGSPKHRIYNRVLDEPEPIKCPECDTRLKAIRTKHITEHAVQVDRLCRTCDMVIRYMRQA